MSTEFFTAGVLVAEVVVKQALAQGGQNIGDEDFFGGSGKFVTACLATHTFDNVAQAQETNEFAYIGRGQSLGLADF